MRTLLFASGKLAHQLGLADLVLFDLLVDSSLITFELRHVEGKELEEIAVGSTWRTGAAVFFLPKIIFKLFRARRDGIFEELLEGGVNIDDYPVNPYTRGGIGIINY